jgi:hypothetical protein
MAYFKALLQHLSGGTKENHEKPQPGWLNLRPEIELRIFQIQSRRINRSTGGYVRNSLFKQNEII